MRAKFGVFSWVLGVGLLVSVFGIAAFGAATFAIASFGKATIGMAQASESKERELSHDDERYEKSEMQRAAASEASDLSATYVEECGACHLAYPAGFLPSRSWSTLISNLEDHFGENAQLDAKTQTALLEYLTKQSAENSDSRRAAKFSRGVAKSDVPLRITELPYFKRKHDEVPDRLVFDNPEVGSFSQCQACHGDRAEQGYFDEDTVDIPGYGRWDD